MVLAHVVEDGTRTNDIKISVDVTFDSMMLSDNTLSGLKNSGFYRPSPIQLHGIPLGKCGFDLFLEAKSGTGKTAVFTVIALEKLDLDKALQTVILAPTREIASQISDVIKQVGSRYPGLNVEVVMGGLPIEEDIEKFQKKVHILVGSPGRMRHLIRDKHIDVSAVRLLVLDEADKLMDKSFKPDINYIFSVLPKQKQVIMSSATYPETLKSIMENYVQKAQHICPDSTSILLGIKQFITTVKPNTNIVRQTQNKFEELLKILSSREFKQCLIFCNYQVRVGEICKMLIREKWPADKLHGQLEQTERLDALRTLQEYKCRILVSTDLAARGIDASNVDLVINFEPPSQWQTYLHRIGRAGRFGSYGIAITILSEGKEFNRFKEIIGGIGTALTMNYLWSDSALEINNSDTNNENHKPPTQEIMESSKTEYEKYDELESKCTRKASLTGETTTLSITKTQSLEGNPREALKSVNMSNPLENDDKTYSELNIKQEYDMSDLNLKKEQINDLCNDFTEILNQQANTNNIDCESFGITLITNTKPEQHKLESFNDLMASFNIHEPSNEDNEIPDVTFRTYFDSMPNDENVTNILLELHDDIDSELVVCNGTDSAINSATTSKSSYNENNGNKQLNKNSDTEYSANCTKVLNRRDLGKDKEISNLKEVITDKHGFDINQTSHYALQNAGLPTSFGSKKHSKRAETKQFKNSEHVTNHFKSNIVHNKSNKNYQQIYSKPKDFCLNSSEATTSFQDDGYNTHSGLHSRSTKCMLSKSKSTQSRFSRNNNEAIYRKISSKTVEPRSDVNSTYNNWYKQLKINMKQFEMSLYINELSNM